MTVTNPKLRRFTPSNPCPICGGHQASPRGQGVRCYGFISEDGQWAHCTRPEDAGDINIVPNSETYPHRLTGGACRCGVQHGAARSEPAGAGESRGRARVVNTWDYHDAGGELLFQVVKYKPKSFKQRRPLCKLR